MYASDLHHAQQSLEDKLHRLYTLNRDKTIDLGFRPPYLELLEKLGNPHLSLPPTIHVAGTNGKGSVIAMMRACLEQAGYKAHVYTSPHLVQFNERIILAGQMIDDQVLENLIDEVLDLNEGKALTFFEITTAIAFKAFSCVPADFLLLEVGLGGRLDCTNVITDPILTIINTVALDHTEFLGEKLEQIATEKAGILKHQIPCIVGPQKPEAMQAIQRQAKTVGVPLIAHTTIDKSSVQTNMVGVHQTNNACVAKAALEYLKQQGYATITGQHISKGLMNVKWPARLQKLDIESRHDVWLDGGHNQDAAQNIAQQIEQWRAKDKGPVYLILGMMKHKDPRQYLVEVLPHIDGIIATTITDEPQALPSQDLAEIINTLAPDKLLGQDETVRRAISRLRDFEVPAGVILVCGSLYLAGQVLQDP